MSFIRKQDRGKSNLCFSHDHLYHPSLQRIRHYMDWNTNCIQYLAMREVHSTFITEILKTAANFSKQDDGE